MLFIWFPSKNLSTTSRIFSEHTQTCIPNTFPNLPYTSRIFPKSFPSFHPNIQKLIKQKMLTGLCFLIFAVRMHILSIFNLKLEFYAKFHPCCQLFTSKSIHPAQHIRVFVLLLCFNWLIWLVRWRCAIRHSATRKRDSQSRFFLSFPSGSTLISVMSLGFFVQNCMYSHLEMSRVLNVRPQIEQIQTLAPKNAMCDRFVDDLATRIRTFVPAQ